MTLNTLRQPLKRKTLKAKKAESKLRRAPTTLLALLALSISVLAAANGAWLAKVPARERDRQNPYRGQDDAVAAGRLIFLDHCAQCHGPDALGTKKRPPLRSARVQQQATEGDLHWLIYNGNMKKGMPSWAKLPDQQIWQVITYVRSLGPPDADASSPPAKK
jgi:mono/diheme cytochrome c family protein